MDNLERSVVAEIPRLRRYARALTRNVDAADDLVQASLERALGRLHLWRPGTDLHAWLFTIMHNLNANRVRSERRAPRTVPLDEGDTETAGPQTADGALRLDEIERALGDLSPEHREVVLLVGLEQMTYAQAASVLGIPVGTVMSRLSRARERLRQLLFGAREPSLRRVK